MWQDNQAVVSEARAGVAVPRDHALLIVGMHRSGTSYLGSLFAAAGVHLGDRLLGQGRGNGRGHFEDEEILNFHERCLAAQGLGTEGYATTAKIAVPERLRREAGHLAASRRQRGMLWGWKEPRTTLFLDFWEGVLPESRFVFVFRRPWEVVDSLFRRGDPLFRTNPSHAIAVWTHYNRLLLDFYRRHPEKTFVCEITQAIENPAAVFAAIRAKLGIALGQPPTLFEADLFHQDAGSGHAELLRAISQESHELYLELREVAGSAKAVPSSAGNDGHLEVIRQQSLQHWRDAIVLVQERADMTATIGDLRQQVAEARSEVSRLQAKRERSLSRRLTRLREQLTAGLRRGVSAAHRWPARIRRASEAVVSVALGASPPTPSDTARQPRRRAA